MKIPFLFILFLLTASYNSFVSQSSLDWGGRSGIQAYAHKDIPISFNLSGFVELHAEKIGLRAILGAGLPSRSNTTYMGTAREGVIGPAEIEIQSSSGFVSFNTALDAKFYYRGARYNDNIGGPYIVGGLGFTLLSIKSEYNYKGNDPEDYIVTNPLIDGNKKLVPTTAFRIFSGYDLNLDYFSLFGEVGLNLELSTRNLHDPKHGLTNALELTIGARF